MVISYRRFGTTCMSHPQCSKIKKTSKPSGAHWQEAEWPQGQCVRGHLTPILRHLACILITIQSELIGLQIWCILVQISVARSYVTATVASNSRHIDGLEAPSFCFSGRTGHNIPEDMNIYWSCLKDFKSRSCSLLYGDISKRSHLQGGKFL